MIIAYFGKHSFEEVPTLGIDIAEKVILVKKDFGGCYPISNQFEKRIVIRPLDLQIEFWWDSVDNKEEKLMYSTDYAEVISEKNQLLIYFIKT